jgi:hypothetical protein
MRCQQACGRNSRLLQWKTDWPEFLHHDEWESLPHLRRFLEEHPEDQIANCNRDPLPGCWAGDELFRIIAANVVSFERALPSDLKRAGLDAAPFKTPSNQF